MEIDEYLTNRVEEQINWYDQKSQYNQSCYKRLRLIEIVFAAIIPFLAGIGSVVPYHQIFIGALGVCIAVSAGLSALYRFHENWIEYRTTAETLKHEKFLFLTKCSPYDDDNSFHEFVQRIESLISKQNSKWSSQIKKGPSVSD